MTAPETFTLSSKRPLTTGRRPDMTGVGAKAAVPLRLPRCVFEPVRVESGRSDNDLIGARMDAILKKQGLTKGSVGGETKDLLKAADAALAEGDAAGAAEVYSHILAEDAANVQALRKPGLAE